MAGDDDTMTSDDTGVVAQAPAPAATATPLVLVPGGNPDPIHNLNDIRQAVADLSKTIPDPAHMVEMFDAMAQELRSLSLAQKISKKENALLVAASRKAKVAEVLSKLTNPIISVLKPDGVVYVPTNLVQAGAVILA